MDNSGIWYHETKLERTLSEKNLELTWIFGTTFEPFELFYLDISNKNWNGQDHIKIVAQ